MTEAVVAEIPTIPLDAELAGMVPLLRKALPELTTTITPEVF